MNGKIGSRILPSGSISNLKNNPFAKEQEKIVRSQSNFSSNSVGQLSRSKPSFRDRLTKKKSSVQVIVQHSLTTLRKKRLLSTARKHSLFNPSNTPYENSVNQYPSLIGAFIAVVVEAREVVRGTGSSVGYRFVLLPNGNILKYWEFICFIALIYVAIFTPFQIAFYYDGLKYSNISNWFPTFILDRSLDFVFFLDIIVIFRSAWYDEENKIIFSSKEAATRYIKSWFIVDFIAVLPIEFLLYTFTNSVSAAMRLPKLMRLFRLAKVGRFLKSSALIKRFEEETSIKYGIIRIFKFILLILIIVHWMACFVFLSSVLVSPNENTWVEMYGLFDKPVSSQYATAIYWAVMTLTTVGYGDITANSLTDKWVFSVLMIFSAGIYAYIVGTMCSLIQGLDASTLQFQRTMDEVNEYMNFCKLPNTIRRKIRKYLYYKHGAGIKTFDNICLLSSSIQEEIALYNYEKVLASVPQFRGAPTDFLSAIALAMRPVVFGPNELMTCRGRSGKSMFVLIKGRAQVEVMGKDKLVIVSRILDKGSFFGERSLLQEHSARTATIRTLTFVQAVELHKDDVDPIMKDYPHVQSIVRLSLMKQVMLKNVRNGRLKSSVLQTYFDRQVSKNMLESGPTIIRKLYSTESTRSFTSNGFEDERGQECTKCFAESKLDKIVDLLNSQGTMLSKMKTVIDAQQKAIKELQYHQNPT